MSIVISKSQRRLICGFGVNDTDTGCSVSDDWKYFSNFKLWMEKQDWGRKHLDDEGKILHLGIHNDPFEVHKNIN
jgi:hypothetical protein